MGVEDEIARARALFEAGYRAQMAGKIDEAMRLYRESITCRPTAEAHTFLGWAMSHLGRYEDAIAECEKAIAVDPDFGNPYNDIGSYLFKQGKLDEAIPWLERAITAKRYEPRHYPHCNLGRVYWAKGLLGRAIEEFERALEIDPTSRFAAAALSAVRQQLN
jgi:tetratricopeptide (TPR) repeat protein